MSTESFESNIQQNRTGKLHTHILQNQQKYDQTVGSDSGG